MSSVVSVRSIGWNQPLTGHARRSFTRPSLRRASALEQVFAAVDPLNLELLPWFDAVLLADLRR